VTADLALELPREATAARGARAAVRERFGGQLSPRQLEDLLVVVTELVSNAFRHGEGRIHLRLGHAGGQVSGEVVDQGSGFEAEARNCGVDELGGRGLGIVAALTLRWGVHEGSSHVWFELDGSGGGQRSKPRLGEAQRPDELP
jgi:anti-sigma regulatory factor (Ser/Thr protein kinase)